MTQPVSEDRENIEKNDSPKENTNEDLQGRDIPSGSNPETGKTPDMDAESSASLDAIDDGQKAARFKVGQELTFIRVRFPGNAKSFPFLLGKRTFRYGQTVVAMSDRGMAIGYINSFPYIKKYTADMGQIRSIANFASREDMEKEQDLVDREKKAEELCIKLIEKYRLDMTLTHVQYIQYGKKAVFYFTAPSRVDFRDLVKDLVGDLKMRIELRQISVRDRAAALGAIGACGLQTCCSSFLQRYGQVSMKMAKNQNLALVPSKINGVCGQVKCCIKYEDDVYAEKRKLLPEEGTILEAANGDTGRVYRLHLIIEQFEMMTTSGARRRYARNMYDNGQVLKDFKFPDRFDHVTDETKEVIGFISEEEKHEQEMLKFEGADENGESNTTPLAAATEEAEQTEPKTDQASIDSEENIEEKAKSNNTSNQRRNNNRNRNRNRQNNRGGNRDGNSAEKGEEKSNENSQANRAEGDNKRRDNRNNRNRNRNRNNKNRGPRQNDDKQQGGADKQNNTNGDSNKSGPKE